MLFQYHPYLLFLIASAAVTLSLLIYAVARRRQFRLAPIFIVNMALLTLQSVCNGLEVAGVDLGTKLLWANMQYLFYCYFPLTLLTAALQMTGVGHSTPWKGLLAAGLLSTVFFILVWFDGSLGLVRTHLHLEPATPFPVIGKDYGPLFPLIGLYAHVLLLAATVRMVRWTIGNTGFYRRQGGLTLTGILLAYIPNLLYVMGLSPLRFDITPVFFAPAGLMLAWAIFRYGMLDLVPLARSQVVENMRDGVLVLDLQGRVLDVNAAMAALLEFHPAKTTARDIAIVGACIPELAESCMDQAVNHAEFRREGDGRQRFYEASFSSLTNPRGKPIGRVAIVYETTEKHRVQQEQQRREVDQALSLQREAMARDLHDNLGQVFSFINMQAQGIRRELVQSGVTAGLDRMDRLISAAQDANDELRTYIRNVRAATASGPDLAQVLRADCDRLQEQTGIHTRLILPQGDMLQNMADERRVHLRYLVREALNNVRKHAHANNVMVLFEESPGQMRLTVEDDGIGFDRANAHWRSGVGFHTMQERALELGAEFEIASAPGKGCRITVCIPMEKEYVIDETAVG